MNTRLQVEHPVTELVTGLDLVRLQLRGRRGREAAVRQEDVAWRGSAIECRIYAEDPYNNFLPYPGKITRLTRPLGPGIRLDGCVYDGWTVPMEYDPLLAKLAVWAATRDEAIARMLRALREYDVGGIRTNIGFFRQILEDPEFRAGASAHRVHRRVLRADLRRRERRRRSGGGRRAGGRAAHRGAPRRNGGGSGGSGPSPWRADGPRQDAAMKLDLSINGEAAGLDLIAPAPACRFRMDGDAERAARSGSRRALRLLRADGRPQLRGARGGDRTRHSWW